MASRGWTELSPRPERAEEARLALRLVSQSSAETVAIGRRLGRCLRRGDVVVLSGVLGAGKTTLAQGIAEGVGVADYVTSPTFTLVNEYRPAPSARHPPLYHIDLYRTAGTAEALDLGLDEYLAGPSQGVAVIEWAERAPEALPEEHLLVRLEPVAESGACGTPEEPRRGPAARPQHPPTAPTGLEIADEARLITIRPRGVRYLERLAELREALGTDAAGD
jgi:tRNA threonylcarbamoyladenosine biosynthesis protein TsaE